MKGVLAIVWRQMPSHVARRIEVHLALFLPVFFIIFAGGIYMYFVVIFVNFWTWVIIILDGAATAHICRSNCWDWCMCAPHTVRSMLATIACLYVRVWNNICLAFMWCFCSASAIDLTFQQHRNEFAPNGRPMCECVWTDFGIAPYISPLVLPVNVNYSHSFPAVNATEVIFSLLNILSLWTTCAERN